MAGLVPDSRDEIDPDDPPLKSGSRIISTQFRGFANLANWANGHGKQLIPCVSLSVGTAGTNPANAHPMTVTSGSSIVLHAVVAPSERSTQWHWHLCAYTQTPTAKVSITPSTGSAMAPRAVTGDINTRGEGINYLSNLSGSIATSAAEITVTIAATDGDVYVESLSLCEAPRVVLSGGSPDYGVSESDFRTRSPIQYNASANRSMKQITDALDNLDARRAGLFHWMVPTNHAVVLGGTTGATNEELFTFYPPVYPAIQSIGVSDASVRCWVRARSTSASTNGTVRFDSQVSGDSATINVTGGTWTWYVTNVDFRCEDLSTTNGNGLDQQASGWESVRVRGMLNAADAGQGIAVQSICLVQPTKPY